MNEPITVPKDISVSFKSAFVGVLAIVLLVIVGFLCFHYPPISRPLTLGLTSILLPKDLHDAHFLTGDSRSERSGLGFAALPEEEGFLLGMERVGERTVRVVLMKDATYALFLDGEMLFSRDEPFSLPTLSPNGLMVAYTEPTDETPFDPTTKQVGARSVLTLGSLRSVLYYPVTGKTVVIGTGASPLFLDDTRLIRFTPGGIIMTDLTTGNETVLLQKSLSSLYGPVLQSPNRTLVTMTDVQADTTYVLRVSPSSAETVTMFDIGIMPSALTEAGLYELRNSQNGTSLWRHALEGSSERKIATFPDTFRVSAITVQK